MYIFVRISTYSLRVVKQDAQAYFIWGAACSIVNWLHLTGKQKKKKPEDTTN